MIVAVLGGCSIAITGVSPTWDRTREPACSDTYVPAVIDSFVGAEFAMILAQLAQDSEFQLEAAVVVGMLATSAVFTMSAHRGASKYRACRRAKADWHINSAIAKSTLKSHTEPAQPALPGISVEAPAGSTVSCPARASQSMLKCMRADAVCERVRARLRTLNSDECAFGDDAWCMIVNGRLRCYGSIDTCQARIAAISATYRDCQVRRNARGMDGR